MKLPTNINIYQCTCPHPIFDNFLMPQYKTLQLQLCGALYILVDGKLNVELNDDPLNWHLPTTVLNQQVLIQREIHSTTKLICLRQDEIAQLDSRCDELTKEISFLISKHQRLQNNLADTRKVWPYGDCVCFCLYRKHRNFRPGLIFVGKQHPRKSNPRKFVHTKN